MKGGLRVWLNVCFLLSLLVLALCGASVMLSHAGGPGGGAAYMPPPPCLPPICGPAATKYSQVTEVITPIPAQLRKVRVVAPYLAGVAWPAPLAFFSNHRAILQLGLLVAMSGWCL